MFRRSKSTLSLALLTIVLVGTAPLFAAQTGTGVYAPPALGSFAYNLFAPPLLPGTSYVDPVFGETVRRLTTDHVHDDIYARNMWWSADGTRYLHRTTDGTAFADFWDVIDVATGAVTHTGIPIGTFAADGGFDPVDPNTVYYFSGSAIHKVTLNPDGTWTDAVYWTAPGGQAFKELGGTINWFDASGRYMLVRYGPEPSVHLYDRLNMAAGPYANPIDATNYIDAGSYIGVSPDGQFLVGYQSGPLPLGLNGSGQGVSWRLDHTNRAIAPAPTVFWSLCGDHGSFVSASDGHNYMIVNDCYNQPGLWRADITNDASNLSEAQQQALPNNRLLLAYATWSDFGHMSAVARGPLQDWAFLSTEDGSDTFNSGTADTNGTITPWHAYRQEIIALNVVTGEIRRLAHHRSRGLSTDYYSTPRLSAAWDGGVVGFASNFNQPGVVDIYAISFGSGLTAPSLTSLVPSTVAAGTAGFVLGVNGGGFDPTSVVRWNGAPRATTFVGPTQLQAAISATDVAVAGTATVTVVSTGGATSNTLIFTIAPTYALAVVEAGTGTGVVASAPAGVTCGTSCSASFVRGTAVVLTATPAAGSSFAGWSGCDLVAGAQCTVTLTASRTVTATFQPAADTTPPTVALTAPAAGATVTGSITVSATATDNVGVAGVQFKLDGANLGAALATAPYAVSWNTTTVANGAHTLTAVAWDAAGNTATSVAVGVTVSNTTSGTGSTGGGLVVQNATWTGLVNVTASGNSLLKTSGCDGCYDAGAASQQQLSAGDGYTQFTAGDATTLRVAGLTHAFSVTDPGTIDFGVRLQSGVAEVRENGVYRTDVPFAAGDVFTVTVRSGVVSYAKTGTVFYTSAAPPTYPLFFAAALANLNATVNNVMLAGGSSSATTGSTTSGAAQVAWINAVNVTVTGGSLLKTSGCDGCYDAGAASQQQLAAGAGYVQFTAVDATTLRVVGLTHAFTLTNPGTINFGIRLQSGVAEVRENGAYHTDTRFAAGDVFRVTVQSGVVTYAKNGMTFYRSTLAPTYPLFLAAALASINATVGSAAIVGGP